MDLATIIGLVVALGAILGGFILEGGHLASIAQPTAAIIVLGGTLGAVFVQFPMEHLKRAMRGAVVIFKPTPLDLEPLGRQLVELAQKARREGMVALEQDADATEDPFLKTALQLAVDGSDSRTIRDVMETELSILDECGEAGSKVFEAGGGYAPTVGILGAVLGLIHVMENLAEPEKLGAGIAVAFVATVYGVAASNLFFLPMAGKLKVRHKLELVRYELMIAGVCSLVDGDNPRLIEQKLIAFIDDGPESLMGDADKEAA